MRPFSLKDDFFLDLPVKKVNYEFECEKLIKRETFNEIILHHLGNRQTLSSILDSHVNKGKFTPIGYHFLIDLDGTFYYTRDIENMGAHTIGYNRTSIGIALFGNFNKDIPTEEQISSLKKIILNLKTNYNIKKLIGHNQAVYNFLVKEYPQLNLEQINFNSAISYFEYEKLIADIRDKIFEREINLDIKKLAEKITLCPGFFIQEEIKKINIEFFKN